MRPLKPANRLKAAAAILALAAAILSSSLFFLNRALDRTLSNRGKEELPPGFSMLAGPVVLQSTLMNCGPAAVANYETLFGKPVQLAVIENRLHTSSTGTTLSDMLRVLSYYDPHHHYEARQSSLRAVTDLPAIILHDYHYSIISARDSSGVEIIDPWNGRERAKWFAVERWNVIAIERQ